LELTKDYFIYYREGLLVNSKGLGLEVNIDKSKYIFMFQEQNAGRSHNIKTGNKCFERVEEFKYLGTSLRNQNCIIEEIKSRLNSGNACYHSMQNLFSSGLLSKYMKIKIYKTVILPVVLYCIRVKLGLSH
jgi:UDP-galactopyranose mutase